MAVKIFAREVRFYIILGVLWTQHALGRGLVHVRLGTRDVGSGTQMCDIGDVNKTHQCNKKINLKRKSVFTVFAGEFADA